MGKLADALDKAGYGEETLLSNEEETFTHDVEPEPIIHLRNQEPPPVIEYPEEVEIEALETPETELQMKSPSFPKVQESQHKKDTTHKKISLIEPKSAHSSGAWDERLFKAINKDVHYPEIFKLLRSRILHPIDGRPVPKTVLVTAVAPKEGKSFITANLGVTLAQGLDQHSLLVDCDLRRPSLAELFGIKSYRGLVDYLKGDADLAELLTQTSINKLRILPSGKPPVNPAELLGSARMHDLIEELSSRYQDRMLIFDSAPVNIASETSILAGQVDGIILVIRQGRGSRLQIQKFLATIDRDKLLGVVFNAQTSNVVERSLLKGYGYYGEEKYS